MPVSDEIPLHVRRSQTSPAHGQSTNNQNSNDDTDAQVPPDGLENAPLWKRELYGLLEQPNSSTAAFILHFSLTGLIVLSALVTVLETVPALHSTNGRVWIGLETSFVVLFTFEYIARSLAWSVSWKSYFQWIFSFFGIIDLLAILPYYIELLLHQDTSVLFRFSILRMFRLLRVFRPFSNNHTILLTIEVMYISVRRSQHALLAIGFFAAMIVTVFSTLLYFAERGIWDDTLETFLNSDGDPSQFASIPAAGWFVLVTITTVGYGEITPRSFLGRLLTVPLLVFGLLMIALPSFVLGREFSFVWDSMTKDDLIFEDGTVQNANEPSDVGVTITSPRQSFFDRPGGVGITSTQTLERNQRELHRDIVELRSALESQGELVKRLVRALEAKTER